MTTIAERDVGHEAQADTLSGASLRTVWQLGPADDAATPPDRHGLAAALHGLLERWRAAERHVAELVDGGDASAPPPEASSLLEAIAGYRAEHQRMFEVIRRLESVEESGDFEGLPAID